MAENSKFLESLMTTVFKPAVQEHRHHDALTSAILIYLMSQDKKQKDEAVGLVHTSTSIILNQSGAETDFCSLCGKKPPKVKVGAVPVKLGEGKERVLLFCTDCVGSLHAAFQLM